MCCIGLADVLRGGRKNLDVWSAVQAAIYRADKSWNFRESCVALAVIVVWEVCGVTVNSDKSLIC